jgi:hypothetical protein
VGTATDRPPESRTSAGPRVIGRWWQRHLAGLLLASAFLLPILICLRTQVPARVQIPLTDHDTDPGIPVEIRGIASVENDGTFFVHQIALKTANVGRFTDHEQLGLLVSALNTSPMLKDGELVFEGTACSYRTAPGTRFRENSLLTFIRRPECAPLQGNAPGQITLRLRFTHPARAALWTYARAPGGVPPDALLVSRFGLAPSDALYLARGAVMDVYPERKNSRMELLAYMWQLSPSSRWIVWCLVGCSIGVYAAVLLVWRGDRRQSGVPHAMRLAMAAFSAAMGLTAAYAVVVPPFQAADEPLHFLEFASAVGRTDLMGGARSWARLTHFEEIRQHSERQFSPADRDSPGKDWTGVSVPDSRRGPAARALWRLGESPLQRSTAPQALLALRLVNGLIFSMAVTLFVLAIHLFTEARDPALVAIPLFLVPTLPYFGMHVSNYALLLSVYVLFSAGVAVAFWDGPRSYMAGPVLGISLLSAVVVSRSALPLVPLAATLMFARILLGDRDGRRGPAFIYWVALLVPLIAAVVLGVRAYPGLADEIGLRLGLRRPWLVSFVQEHPILLVIPAAACLAAELAIRSLVERFGRTRHARAGITIAWLAWVGAAAVLAVAVSSVWIPFPVLDSMAPPHVVAPLPYIKSAELACLTLFRFGRPDNLTSLTFWGGFGWLETLLPARLVSLLAGTSGLALAALLVWVGRRRSGRALVWLACALAGYVLSVAAYAASLSSVRWDVHGSNLHGRYLLGLYLSVLVIAWSVLARISLGPGTRRCVMAGAGLGCIVVHAYSMTFILSRYF